MDLHISAASRCVIKESPLSLLRVFSLIHGHIYKVTELVDLRISVVLYFVIKEGPLSLLQVEFQLNSWTYLQSYRIGLSLV